MPTLAPLPRTRATTAWALMKAVNRVLLANPRRLDMSSWISAFKDKTAARKVSSQPPACGTICCYAGWVKVLATGTKGGEHADTYALQTLAGDSGDGSINWPLRRELGSAFLGVDVYDQSGHLLKSGTRVYASAVVARFEAIMKRHEAYLKARRIEL